MYQRVGVLVAAVCCPLVVVFGTAVAAVAIYIGLARPLLTGRLGRLGRASTPGLAPPLHPTIRHTPATAAAHLTGEV